MTKPAVNPGAKPGLFHAPMEETHKRTNDTSGCLWTGLHLMPKLIAVFNLLEYPQLQIDLKKVHLPFVNGQNGVEPPRNSLKKRQEQLMLMPPR